MTERAMRVRNDVIAQTDVDVSPSAIRRTVHGMRYVALTRPRFGFG